MNTLSSIVRDKSFSTGGCLQAENAKTVFEGRGHDRPYLGGSSPCSRWRRFIATAGVLADSTCHVIEMIVAPLAGWIVGSGGACDHGQHTACPEPIDAGGRRRVAVILLSGYSAFLRGCDCFHGELVNCCAYLTAPHRSGCGVGIRRGVGVNVQPR